jgi:hypothetical protein
MADPAFADFSYPSDDVPRGVTESGLDLDTVDVIQRLAPAVGAALGPRIGDCLRASTAWWQALQARGFPSIMAGGFGQHIDTVPATVADTLRGYLTEDDGVVTHWWLMFGPQGLVFDPTAHQFDHRGGVSKKRYLINGVPLSGWEDRWAELELLFPKMGEESRDGGAIMARIRRSLSVRPHPDGV